MKTLIPEKSDDMFTLHDQILAPEGLIKMFLEREENAKRLETKTGKEWLTLSYSCTFRSRIIIFKIGI